MKCALYDDSDNSFIASTEERSDGGSLWQQFNFSPSQAVTASTDYLIALYGDNDVYIKGDAVAGTYPKKDNAGYPDWPSTVSTVSGYQFSIYATYTTIAAPSVTTNAATLVEETTATLNGNVTSDGGAAVTERGFYCDKNADPITKYVVTGTTGAYIEDLTGLDNGDKYYFKAFATNSEATSYGDILDFTTSTSAPSSGSFNIYGWAWSDNIGWISFNCDNPELLSCSTSNYRVGIDSSGSFSGYAWAGGGENADSSLVATIGWIKFDPPADFATYPVNGYPDADFPYSACLDLPGPGQDCDGVGDYTVSGWARAYRAIEPGGQTLGGWDGWIKLRGIWANGVSLNNSPDPSEFEGWAWAGDVIGWISFNCFNKGVCGDSDYKVSTSSNQLPNKSTDLEEKWRCCGGIPSVAKRTSLFLNWTYSDPNGNPQAAYEVWVDESSDFSNPKFNNIVDPGPCLGSDCSYAVNLVDDDEGDWLDIPPLPGGLVWATTYWWKVKVKNSNNVWSNFSDPKSFITPNRASPIPNFILNPASPETGEVVNFTDESKCYLFNGVADIEYDCDAGGNEITYEWDFDDGSPVSTFKGSTTHTYSDLGKRTVRLQVTDDLVGLGLGMCYKEETIELKLPLPTWREITPF